MARFIIADLTDLLGGLVMDHFVYRYSNGNHLRSNALAVRDIRFGRSMIL
jgi:hypothetical protein